MRPESAWTEILANIRERAACRGLPTEEFFPPETPGKRSRMTQAPDVVQRVCDGCPVQAECLGWALAHHEAGVWGGTTDAQRKRILKSRFRVACLRCNSESIVRTPKHQICLSCGLSWKAPWV